MGLGTLEVHAGDFDKGNDHQFVVDELIMKRHSKFFRERIPAAHIEEVEVASEENVKRLGGTIGWGVVGGVLLGPAGLLAGLLLGGKGKKVTFICKLKDGRRFLASTSSKTYTEILATQFSKNKRSVSQDADARKPVEEPSKSDIPISSLREAHDPAKIKIVSKDGNKALATDGVVLRYGRITRSGKEEHFETELANVTLCDTRLLSTRILLSIHADAPGFSGHITLIIDKGDEEKVRSLAELMPYTTQVSFGTKRK